MGTEARGAAALSQRLLAKKVTGYCYIPKALAFVPAAWNIQFVLEVSGAIHLHKSWDMGHECGHSSGMQRRQVLVVSIKPDVSHRGWSGFLIHYNKNCQDKGMFVTICNNWGQTRRQFLSNSMLPAGVKLTLEHRVLQESLEYYSLHRRLFSNHILSVVYFTDPAWVRVNQAERG